MIRTLFCRYNLEIQGDLARKPPTETPNSKKAVPVLQVISDSLRSKSPSNKAISPALPIALCQVSHDGPFFDVPGVSKTL